MKGRITCATVGEPGWRRANTRSLDADAELTRATRNRGLVWCHTSVMTGATCAAKLRDGSPCRSAATDGEFCAYHAAMADQLGTDTVVNGDQVKRRNARQRALVVAQSEPLELDAAPPGAPSGVRPALALTAAEEVEQSAASYWRPRPAQLARPGRHAPVRNAARASDKRSPSPTTAPASRQSRLSCARDLAGSVRRSRRAEGSAIGRGAEESQYGRARADGRAGVRGADPRDRR